MDLALAGQGVLGEVEGLLVPTQRARKSAARLLAEIQVSGWSSPSIRRLRVRVSSLRSWAGRCLRLRIRRVGGTTSSNAHNHTHRTVRVA